MAIERGRLQNFIFDNQVHWNHRAMAAVLGVILKLPPVKQATASRQTIPSISTSCSALAIDSHKIEFAPSPSVYQVARFDDRNHQARTVVRPESAHLY